MKIKHASLSKFAVLNPEGITQGYPYQAIEYIDISSVGSGQLVEQPEEILLKDAPSRAKRIVRNKDIILATVRPNLRSFLFIKNPKNNTIVSTGFAVLRAKDTADPRFIYYAITDSSFTGYLTNNTKGTSYPAIDSDIVLRGDIPDFDFNRQQRIASILSAYDDLIDINRRRIQLLEEAARLLFREWFVYFRFPGHEKVKIVDGVPEGWEKLQVKDIIRTVNSRKKIQKSEYDEAGLYPCVDQSQEHISGYTDRKDYVINNTIPIVIFGDHTRIIKYVDFPFVSGADGTQLLLSKHNKITSEVLYFILKNINLSNYFYARHFKFLKDQWLLVPSEELCLSFGLFSKNIMKQIGVIRNQNQKLAQARDLLLPRLMSGKIEV